MKGRKVGRETKKKKGKVRGRKRGYDTREREGGQAEAGIKVR